MKAKKCKQKDWKLYKRIIENKKSGNEINYIRNWIENEKNWKLKIWKQKNGTKQNRKKIVNERLKIKNKRKFETKRMENFITKF